MRNSTLIAVVILATLSSCAISVGNTTNHEARATASPQGMKANNRQAEDLFKQMSTLTGSWTGVDNTGSPCHSTFVMTSSGSVVRELMFPGSEHEMTNMIHLDNDAVVLTHYCGVGNQPRLKGRPGKLPNQIVFELDRVSNLARSPDHYMGALTLTFNSADSYTAEWTAFQKGKPPEHAVFKLTRTPSAAK